MTIVKQKGFSFPVDKIKKKLDNLNPNKSPEPDEFHPRILKELSNEFLKIIRRKNYLKTGRMILLQCIKKEKKSLPATIDQLV